MLSPPPTIEQIIERLMQQVVYGKAHLAVASGLADSDPVILDMAKAFFGMTLDAHFYSALMYAARVHDTQNKAVTMTTLLERAGKEKAKYGSDAEVEQAIKAVEDKLTGGLVGSLKTLTDRRNQWLAHNDPRTLTNPAFAISVVKGDYEDLDKIYRETGQIVNEFSRLYRDVTGNLDLLSQTDYKSVLECLLKVKTEQVRRFEKEFPGTPVPFAKPKGC